ncbi:MAG: hypothetical protein BGO04_11565 [Microbacterium sp. 70-38]|nr:MAG: hypothetical protein BGO04_11565 [Microbacterium sp. 70-38]
MAPSFTVAEARAAGVEPGRLKRRDLATPFHGVRSTAASVRTGELCALLRGLGPRFVAFGPTAALIHGMQVPDALTVQTRTAHIAGIRPTRAPRSAGVSGASLTLGDLDLVTVDGATVTSRARTWVDLARFLDVPRLVAAADALCSPRTGICSLSELRSALVRAGRVIGVSDLRVALDLANPSAESIAESLIRVALVTSGLPEPVANATIRDHGRFVARVDLLFERYGVILEYEGLHHATDPRQWRRDLTRIGELQRLGFLVERAHADDLRDPRALIARIRAHLRRRGWTG